MSLTPQSYLPPLGNGDQDNFLCGVSWQLIETADQKCFISVMATPVPLLWLLEEEEACA